MIENNPHNETNARLSWLDAETEYLRESYVNSQKSIQQIADNLGRSYDSVSSRISVMKLRRSKPK